VYKFESLACSAHDRYAGEGRAPCCALSPATLTNTALCILGLLEKKDRRTGDNCKHQRPYSSFQELACAIPDSRTRNLLSSAVPIFTKLGTINSRHRPGDREMRTMRTIAFELKHG